MNLTSQIPDMEQSKSYWEKRINNQLGRIIETESQMANLNELHSNQKKHLNWLSGKLAESQTFELGL